MVDERRVELEPAFILHQRDFRDTSKIIDMYTANFGRVSVIAKGVRTARSALRSTLQPFQPLRISWAGKSTLKTLTGAESAGCWSLLQGTPLLCGFYVNELTMRLAPTDQPDPELFVAYQQVIHQLSDQPVHAVLREYELSLLASVGHGLNLLVDVSSGLPVQAELTYHYIPQYGPQIRPQVDVNMPSIAVKGQLLLAMQAGDFSARETLAVAARILRLELDHYLGAQPLKSRQVLLAMLNREKSK